MARVCADTNIVMSNPATGREGSSRWANQRPEGRRVSFVHLCHEREAMLIISFNIKFMALALWHWIYGIGFIALALWH